MSEDTSKKSKGGRPEAYTELQKEIMFNDYVGGMTMKAVAEKHGVNYIVLTRHAKKDGWKERKEEASVEVKQAALAPVDIVRGETMDKTLRMIHKLVTDTERRMHAGDDSALRVNLKTLVDAMDKLIKLQMHVETGGVQQSQVHVKKETVDWNKLIEQSVKAKKDHGEGFDEKEFLKDVLDIEVKKK